VRRRALLLAAVVALATAGARWTAPVELPIASGAWSAPGNVASGLLFWYDAAEPATMGLAPHLRFWFDKAVAGRGARPSAAGSPPYATALAGRAQVAMSDALLALPAPIRIEPLTFIAVLRFPAATGTYPLLGSSAAAEGFAVEEGRIRCWYSGTSAVSPLLGTLAGDRILTVRFYTTGYDSATLNSGFDALFTATPTSTVDLLGGIALAGGQRRFTGGIMEALAWNRILTATERQAATRALGAKWGISVP